MNGLDLFSGIGGITLALKPWVTTIAYCEQDRYAQGVLLSRMRDGYIDSGPIWDDVRTLSASDFATEVDIIFGGFPCQDISTAGRGAGLAGERSGLFFEIVRLTDELRPAFVFLENVPAITARGLGAIVGEFAELGYDCRWTLVSAAELGAPHIRKRWFLLAYANSSRESSGAEGRNLSRNGTLDGGQDVADAEGIGWRQGRPEFRSRERIIKPSGRRCSSGKDVDHANRKRHLASQEEIRSGRNCAVDPSWWFAEPHVGRMVNGLSNRVDRIRCLGNAVVPIQAREAFKRLSGIEN